MKKEKDEVLKGAELEKKKADELEKSAELLEKNIRDKENQISVYQKSAIQNYEIAEITRKELDHTQRENEEQNQLISNHQQFIVYFLFQKMRRRKQ